MDDETTSSTTSSKTANTTAATSPKRKQAMLGSNMTLVPHSALNGKKLRARKNTNNNNKPKNPPPSTTTTQDDDDSMSIQSNSDATTAAENLNSNTVELLEFSTKADFRINVPPDTENAEKTLVKVLRQVLLKFQQVAEVYFDTFDEDNNKIITTADEIPDRLLHLREYFPNIRPNPKGGFVYSKVKINSNVPLHSILAEINWWFKDKEHGFYPWSVQNIDEIGDAGWLLFSIHSIPRDLFTVALNEHVKNDDIGLQWKGVEQESKVPYKDKVKAYHVQCDASRVLKIQGELGEKLGSTSTIKVLGITVRFVPEISYARNPLARGKIALLRDRQRGFLDTMLTKNCETIVDLDVTVKDGDERLPSLRQLIMGIHSRNYPHMSLFHSIGKSWRNDNHFCFYFVPKVKEEAELMVDNLIPYLKHAHGPAVLKYFNSSAVNDNQDAIYDPDTGHVSTITDKLVDDLLNADQDLVFDIKKPATQQSNRPNTSNLNLPTTNIQDDATISTIGTLGSTGGAEGLNLSFTPSNVVPQSQFTMSQDDASAITMETQVQTMQQSIGRLEQMMQDVIQSLPNSNNRSSSPPAEIKTTSKATPSSTGGGSG